MIDFYYWPTQNGWKVAIMLEECGLDYEVHPVDIGRGDQFEPAFLAISPNNRIPALVDRDVKGKPLGMFESGAILVYLAEKTGRLMPADPRGRVDVLQWLFWQIGGLGPIAGQLGHFISHPETRIEYAVERYSKEYSRLLDVLNQRLDGRDYICGEYSIADIACWPWLRSSGRLGHALDEFPNIERWFEAVAARPAVERGIGIGAAWWDARGLDDEARKKLFNQPAANVSKQAAQAGKRAD